VCPNSDIFAVSFESTPTASQWFAYSCSSLHVVYAVRGHVDHAVRLARGEVAATPG
jgi:hypothetical protein